MQAKWNNQIIAQAPIEELVYIEGNYYFPPGAVKNDHLAKSDHQTTCFWKGQAHYYDVTAGGQVNQNAAWYYPEPLADSLKRVKKDYSNYIAFWNGVEVSKASA